jgi:predicted glycogen debranching enzyme
VPTDDGATGTPVRIIPGDAPATPDPREWIVANGLGGYASGTIEGRVTRRYHGVLIAALPAPFGRLVLLNHVAETIEIDGRTQGFEDGRLVEFRLEAGLPTWRYEVAGATIEKQIVMPSRQNIVHVAYRLVEGPARLRLRLRPFMHFRPIEAPVAGTADFAYSVRVDGDRTEISTGEGLPTLRLRVEGEDARLVLDGGSRRDLVYELEAQRGYDSHGALWTPGFYSGELVRGGELTLVAGAERWHAILALRPNQAAEYERSRRRRLVRQAHPAAREGFGAELVLAADAFVITPAGRVVDIARAQAEGDGVRTVIAGYHWFTDWGRDTMISLEGLTLATGRALEAGWILRTFAHYSRDGLIPNMFPEGGDEGLYHTADATLWFFHALDRYVETTGDRATLRDLLPKLRDIVEHHRRGTRFGIGVDPADGLLRQGAPGYQLTWMDAKVGDWVVTPRRGKAVEVNALWYNALRLLEGWLAEEGDAAAAAGLRREAERAEAAFNARFWHKAGGYLYDVVDGEHGDDPAFRPNQLFAISLKHPVLARERWKRVVDLVRERLLTPVGLRSLAPGHPDYKPRYFGDLRARDAAYHQGTVWAWLIGPYVDAWLKLHPGDRAAARALLSGFEAHLDEAGVGTISEVFDAEPPYTPRGCIAQAWSVAEVLRCWIRTAPDAT